jgi:Zn-finger nucleic acid-binding protein
MNNTLEAQRLAESMWAARRNKLQSIINEDTNFLVRPYKTADHFFLTAGLTLPLPPDSRPSRSEYFKASISISKKTLALCPGCKSEFRKTEYTEQFAVDGLDLCPLCLVASMWAGSPELNQTLTKNQINESLILAEEIFNSEELRAASLDGFQTHHGEDLARTSQEMSLAFMKRLTIFPKSDYFAALNRSPRMYALHNSSTGSSRSTVEGMCEFLSGAQVVHEHDKAVGGDHRSGGIWLFPDISFGQQNLFANPTGYERAWAQTVLGKGHYRVISDGDNWIQELHDLVRRSAIGSETTGGAVCQKRM